MLQEFKNKYNNLIKILKNLNLKNLNKKLKSKEN
jgi:hypothetical protein